MTDTEIVTTPMDVGELHPCASCGKGVMHSGNPTFYEVEVRQCLGDTRNIQRMLGLEQMMGGAGGIARALSPDNTVAHRIGKPTRLHFCMDCAMQPPLPVAVLVGEGTSDD